MFYFAHRDHLFGYAIFKIQKPHRKSCTIKHFFSILSVVDYIIVTSILECYSCGLLYTMDTTPKTIAVMLFIFRVVCVISMSFFMWLTSDFIFNLSLFWIGVTENDLGWSLVENEFESQESKSWGNLLKKACHSARIDPFFFFQFSPIILTDSTFDLVINIRSSYLNFHFQFFCSNLKSCELITWLPNLLIFRLQHKCINMGFSSFLVHHDSFFYQY